MLRLVNKIPVNTKNVLIHLTYFFIYIIILPNFYENLIVPYTECISKYELLLKIKDVYNKDLLIGCSLSFSVGALLTFVKRKYFIKKKLNRIWVQKSL